MKTDDAPTTAPLDPLVRQPFASPAIERAANCAAIECAIACLQTRHCRFLYEYKKHASAVRRIKAELAKILEEMKQR